MAEYYHTLTGENISGSIYRETCNVSGTGTRRMNEI